MKSTVCLSANIKIIPLQSRKSAFIIKKTWTRPTTTPYNSAVFHRFNWVSGPTS